MVQGIGSGGGLDASQIRSLFSKLDADANGSVTRDEFISGAPGDVSSDQAATLFDSLDSSGSGSLSEDDLLSAFERLNSQTQSALIQQQQPPKEPPDPSKMFDDADEDGDGTVTREEFIAARPDDVSEEMAGSLFDKLDSESAGSLTKDEFVTAMEANKPDGPGPGESQNAGMSASTLSSLLDLLKSYQIATSASDGTSSNSNSTTSVSA